MQFINPIKLIKPSKPILGIYPPSPILWLLLLTACGGGGGGGGIIGGRQNNSATGTPAITTTDIPEVTGEPLLPDPDALYAGQWLKGGEDGYILHRADLESTPQQLGSQYSFSLNDKSTDNAIIHIHKLSGLVRFTTDHQVRPSGAYHFTIRAVDEEENITEYTVQLDIKTPPDNTIFGTKEGSTLMGTGGDDLFFPGLGADVIHGDAGADQITYIWSHKAVHIVNNLGSGGTAEGDRLNNIETIIGSPFDDILIGSSQDDRLEGYLGGDKISGGGGSDTALYSQSHVAVHVNLTTGQGQYGHAESDQLQSIENIVGSAHDDHLIGNEMHNILTGGAGADRLDGMAGDDRLNGGLGGDRLNGGGGRDVADYTTSPSGVTIDLDDHSLNSGGEATGDRLKGIENIFGSAFNDHLVGDSLANRLEGRDGDDILSGQAGADMLLGGLGADIVLGGAGDDTLLGGAGDDYFKSGAGADSIDGGAGDDMVAYIDFDVPVIIDLMHENKNREGEEKGDNLTHIENMSGSRWDDQLFGDDERNHIQGSIGADKIWGRGGADRLEGGEGDDVIYGGGDNDVLLGGDGVDMLKGNGGADMLRGGAGDDILIGGAGINVLNGGAGADKFVLYEKTTLEAIVLPNAGTNRVTDFKSVEGDRIQIDLSESAQMALSAQWAGQFMAGLDLKSVANAKDQAHANITNKDGSHIFFILENIDYKLVNEDDFFAFFEIV